MDRCSTGRPQGAAPRTYASIIIAVAVLAPQGASLAADYEDWSYSTEIFINTSSSGANVGVPIFGFPLLVRLDADNFVFAEAKGRGEDIRFSNIHGKPLPYQIERWDSAGAKADLWVLADTVKANNSTQALRMHWGHATAKDSSDPAAVFPASKGMISVFHLGGSGARANAAAGGTAAIPGNYDGDESRAGVIGLCDSLDGGAPGDHLDLGAGYADFSGGFSWSAWMNPTSARRWSRMLELGNPLVSNQGRDHIVVGRQDATNHLYVQNNTQSPLRSDELISNNAWHFYTITVSSSDTVRWYKNGALVDSRKMLSSFTNNPRTRNWIGRSAWTGDEYFQGKLDEVRISRVPQSATWIKLSYESQKPGQTMVTLKPPKRCVSNFAPPADTLVDEGSAVVLSAKADCAGGFNWSAVSGPAPRILDPGVKEFQFTAPRVAGDAEIVLRFTAQYGDTTLAKDVKVTVKESIPEPAFTLPANLPWNGKDSLRVTATISNLTAIRAARDSVLTWDWSLEDLAVDTAWSTGALTLSNATAYGTGKITLCLSNNCTPVCRSSQVIVQATTSVTPVEQAGLRARPRKGRLADGRMVPEGGDWKARGRAFPATPRP